MTRRTENNMKKTSRYFGLAAIAASMLVLSACDGEKASTAAPEPAAPAMDAAKADDTNAVSNTANTVGAMKPAANKPAKKKPAGSAKKPST
ncbi:MAG: hypothetical protein ACI9OD_003212 [Limisphaerales bacterium]|jgi:hypothetical protein